MGNRAAVRPTKKPGRAMGGNDPSDAELVKTLLAFANGERFRLIVHSPIDKTDPSALPLEAKVYSSDDGLTRTNTKTMAMYISADGVTRTDYRDKLDAFVTNRSAFIDRVFMESLVGLMDVLRVMPVFTYGIDGVRLQYQRYFPSFKTAIDFSVMLLLDDSLGFGPALCKCQYSQCRKFYLAKRNPKGGPANRNYCCPDHRDLSHDAKENRGAKSARKPK